MHNEVPTSRKHTSKEATRTVLMIVGMKGNNCRERLIRYLEAVPGVREAAVSLYRSQAIVSHERTCEVVNLMEAVEGAGFIGTIQWLPTKTVPEHFLETGAEMTLTTAANTSRAISTHPGEPNDTHAPRAGLRTTREHVRARAFDIYNERCASGEPGDESSDWYRAEAELGCAGDPLAGCCEPEEEGCR
jgi:copper chaperone CopZ